jgi:two-component system response regulator PilR (NtrC family)
MSTAESPSAPADSRAPRILVVDDERSMRELLAIVLKREGYEVLLADSGRAAIALLEREPVDLLISDIKMPDVSGVEVLRAAKQIDSDILGIMITAFASTDSAVEAMRLGACDYLSKPFDVDVLRMKVREKIEHRQIRQENVLLKRSLGLSHQFANIIGRSASMLEVFKMIETVARTNSTILLTGESGTGKGLVAQAIHHYSLRRDRPMVALNCGALPEALLESELFGHMRGSFTGADANKKGLLEAAERGTVFLDEIGEMSPVVQVKLLRVLQERCFERVGGEETVEVDVRVVSATNRDLPAMARCRSGSSAAWEASMNCRPTSGSSRPPTPICPVPSPRADSARTCTTGLTSFPSRCRRCVSGARTSRSSPSTFSRSTPSRWGSR